MFQPSTQDAVCQPTVYIIDDDLAVRESMACLIKSHGYAVQVYDSAQTYLDNYHQTMAGCILLDIQMPQMDGLELQRLLVERGCTLPIIFMTGYAEVSIVVAAIRLGGFELLEKPFDSEILLGHIRNAVALDEQARRSPNDHQDVMRRISRLTQQEKRIMRHITTGLTNKQVAQELGLSHKTVEVYRTRVMQKMQVSSLPVLVRLLVENGLG